MRITFHWGSVGGVLECVGLDVHLFDQHGALLPKRGRRPQAISTSLIRSLPVASLIQEAAADFSKMLEGTAAEVPGWNPEARKQARKVLGSLTKTRRGHTWTPEFLEQAAALYIDALNRKQPPRQAVATGLGVDPSTASKIITRCREEGLLAPTTPGKPSRPHTKGR